MYKRVIPRDLFNEAKLLKSLGQLALIIHDGRDAKRLVRPEWRLCMELEDEEPGFVVRQCKDGSLYVENLYLFAAGRCIDMATNYNSKSPYPLCFEEAEYALDDEGNLSQEFVAFLDSLLEGE